jgi:hypothetical protein
MNKENTQNDYNKLIKQINAKRYNHWYKLIDLVEVKNISYKSLKNMVKEIYNKYHPQGTIYKDGRRYHIHHSILDAFKLKQPRKNKKPTIYSYQWKSNISWTTKDYYDKEYHEQLIYSFKLLTPEVNYIETIELDKMERYHVHLLADEDPTILKPIAKGLLDYFLDNDRHYRLYCEKVLNKGCSVDYLIKNPQ